MIWCSLGFAQQPDVRPYETEEDLWEALREGEITFDDYRDLLEIFRTGTDSTFVPGSDLELLPGSDAGYLSPADTLGPQTPLPSPPQQSNQRIRWSWRGGYDTPLSHDKSDDGYMVGRFRQATPGSETPAWSGLVKVRRRSNDVRWQHRVFEYRVRGITAQAGNVEPRWGRGLVVGRRSRLIGSRSGLYTDADFWQPDLSRFNGLRVMTESEKRLAVDALISEVRSPQLIERMGAAQAVLRLGATRLGVSGLTGRIAQRDSSGVFAQQVAGAHLRIGNGEHTLLTEIAVADNGHTAKAAEALWRFERGRFHGRAWSYAEGFVNPWGGGPAHSDRTTIVLDGIEESYSSRTTGERGFLLSTRLDPRPVPVGGRLGAQWDWMTHRETPQAPLKHDWTVRLWWRARNLSLRPFVRGHSEDGSPGQYASGFYGYQGTADRHISGRFEYGRHRVNSDRFVRAGVGLRWRLSQSVRLEPALRWVDPDLETPMDGYWYFYLTEVIFGSSAWRMEAALVWQQYEDRDREDVVELRVRVVGRNGMK